MDISPIIRGDNFVIRGADSMQEEASLHDLRVPPRDRHESRSGSSSISADCGALWDNFRDHADGGDGRNECW
jgi:hypothetical protein